MELRKVRRIHRTLGVSGALEYLSRTADRNYRDAMFSLDERRCEASSDGFNPEEGSTKSGMCGLLLTAGGAAGAYTMTQKFGFPVLMGAVAGLTMGLGAGMAIYGFGESRSSQSKRGR